MSNRQRVLIADQWVESRGTSAFYAEDPALGTALPTAFPVSPWAEIDAALDAAVAAFDHWLSMPNAEQRARFLDDYADRIDQHADALAALAHQETALPITPRLRQVELPRTTNQLRQCAAAARSGSWIELVIDEANNIRSCLEPLGPVAVFGPNNFPFAFNSIAGGDFAAALAVGCPVIAKANTSHPATTAKFAELALAASQSAGLPVGAVQLLFRTSHADGVRLAGDPRLGAIGYTGSRAAGLQLKRAADAVGKPIFLELSSINPVIILPGALAERGDKLAEEFQTSCLMGMGQFCTNPGLVIMIDSPETQTFVHQLADRFRQAPVSPLLGEKVRQNLVAAVQSLQAAGAQVVVGGHPVDGPGYRHQHTLLTVEGQQFVSKPDKLQTEAFGNVSLVVLAANKRELLAILEQLEGNLTGCVYSATDGRDDELYGPVARRLGPKVGRLLNDKMPTGVAVSPAMQHGGPFPATGHPGFTAVGVPASLRRFTALRCYDNVRPHRLPSVLRSS